MDNQNISYQFRIENYTGASVDISHLSFAYWISDNIIPSSITYANDYGGNTTPFAGWNGPSINMTLSPLSTPITLPTNRQAALKVSFGTNQNYLLPTGTVWDGIKERLVVSYPVQFLNRTNYYSQDPGAAYVDDPFRPVLRRGAHLGMAGRQYARPQHRV